MKKIFKYPIPIDDKFSLFLPMFSQILTVQLQKSEPFIWCLIDAEQTMKIERQFRLYGTGMTVDNDYNIYIGTFQMLQGSLVWHLFEWNELPF